MARPPLGARLRSWRPHLDAPGVALALAASVLGWAAESPALGAPGAGGRPWLVDLGRALPTLTLVALAHRWARRPDWRPVARVSGAAAAVANAAGFVGWAVADRRAGPVVIALGAGCLAAVWAAVAYWATRVARRFGGA